MIAGFRKLQSEAGDAQLQNQRFMRFHNAASKAALKSSSGDQLIDLHCFVPGKRIVIIQESDARARAPLPNATPLPINNLSPFTTVIFIFRIDYATV